MEGNDQGGARAPPAVAAALGEEQVAPADHEPVGEGRVPTPSMDGHALNNAVRSVVDRTQETGDADRAYAALDLGTNNCRLLVARPSPRGFKVIDAFSRIIRLGEGVAASRRLSQGAIERTIDALKICAAKIRHHRVARSGLIATEACRLADNAPQFLSRVREETDLDIKVVSREAEARLAVSGCASLIDASSDLALVFDIGGGSSELIWLDLEGHKRKFADAVYRPPGDAELHRGMDVAAGGRRDACGALRRPVRGRGNLPGHGRRYPGHAWCRSRPSTACASAWRPGIRTCSAPPAL